MQNYSGNIHKNRVMESIHAMSGGSILPNKSNLRVHCYFQSADKRFVLTCVPFPEMENFAINKSDLDKIVGHFKTGQVTILFAKFLREGLTLYAWTPIEKIKFNNLMNEGKPGAYYLFKQSAIDKLRHADILPLFDGIDYDEFKGLFA